MKSFAVLMAALCLGACSKNIQTTEAVRDGVVDYLSGIASKTGLDMSSMDVQVASVMFQRDEARATVSIRPKSVQGNAGMEITYTLDRKGDKWVVRGAGEVSGGAHGAAPQGGEPAPGSQALPPGHPPIGSKQ